MKKNTSYTIKRARRLPVILIGEGLLVGAAGGLVVLLYRLALTFAGDALNRLLALIEGAMSGLAIGICGIITVLFSMLVL